MSTLRQFNEDAENWGLFGIEGMAAMHANQGSEPAIDLGSVINALPGLVWTTRSDGTSDFANRTWCEYTGLGLDEARGHGWLNAIHPADRSNFMGSWDLIRRSGSADEIDVRLRRFDGGYRWFAFRPAPFNHQTGDDELWCWLAVDIDENPRTDGRMRRLLDMLPIQVAFLNLAGTSEYSNRKTLDDYGMTLDELAAWTTSGAILPEDFPVVEENMARLMTTGEMFDAQIRMHYKDGSYRWMHCLCVPCRDAQDNVMRYVTCQLDIDDLKRAEGLLAAEVTLLEMVALDQPLEQILDTLCRLVEELRDGCTCSVLAITPERHFRIGAAPSLPNSYRDGLDGKAIDDGADPYSWAVAQKGPVVSSDLANDSRWAGSAWTLLMKQNGFASCWTMPVMSASGQPSAVIAIHRREPREPTDRERDLIDRFAKIARIVIDRAEADEALRSSEQELRGALAQLAEGQRLSKTGSFTSDLQIDRHEWSDEYYNIFEIDPRTSPNVAAIRSRVHPDDLDTFDKEIGRGLEGFGSDFLFRIITPTAGLKYLRGVARLMDNEAGRPKFMGAVQDITASRVAEEALNQARSELAHVARVATLNAMTASIAHEVSQPLSGILTNANTSLRMLAADPPNLSGVAEAAKRTIRDAGRASEVIKRLRAMFSKNAPTTEKIDLNDTARELIALSSGELQRGRVVLHTQFAEDLPPITGDRVQLQQVILNLLLNGADAMAGIDDRPRTLLVRTERTAQGEVQLLVRDVGIGLDDAASQKLFDAFYTTKAHGMGIGLSISRSIIENHSGELWAASNDGPGATFGFRIPRAVEVHTEDA